MALYLPRLLSIAFLLGFMIFVTASSDLLQRDSEEELLEARGPMDRAFEDAWSERSELSKYDRLLLARELIDLVLNTDYITRELGEELEQLPLQKRAPPPSTSVYNIMLKGPEGLVIGPYQFSLSKDTFQDVREKICEFWKEAFHRRAIHVWWKGKEADYQAKLRPSGVQPGDTIHYTIDTWTEQYTLGGTRGAPRAGNRGVGPVKKGGVVNGKGKKAAKSPGRAAKTGAKGRK